MLPNSTTGNLDDHNAPVASKRVAILVPCYNEEKYIERCLDSLLATDYDKSLLDIVVIDGMSTDGTRQIVAQYTAKHPCIRVIDNPQRIKPAALNIGIRETNSDIVMRVDAHSIYESQYISKLVAGIDHYQADNIGGLVETRLDGNWMNKAIGIAYSHPFAAGNALWRTGPRAACKVDTVPFGCYRREVFHRIGNFNERLIRAQDREFNYRLRAAGGRIVLDPKVRCTYFHRRTLRKYAVQVFNGAYWLWYARRFTNTAMVSYRNLVPLAFLLWHMPVVIGFVASAPIGFILSLPLALYWALGLFFSIQVGVQHRSFIMMPCVLLAFAVTHYSYGLGGLAGLTMAYLLGKVGGR